jgi:hypothetical protein
MVLAIVLGTMAVATILLATWARTAIRAHRQQRVFERQQQARWLVEAGIERAVARLAGADDYTGETWNLTAQELAGPHGAAVAIQVEPVGGAPRRRIVRVQVDYPDDPVRRIRRSKKITVDQTRLGESQ